MNGKTRNQYRAVLMAAVMVVSMVAMVATFAAPAAAQGTVTERTSDLDVNPGEQVTIETSVQVDQDTSDWSFEDRFTPGDQLSGSISSVEVDGQTVFPLASGVQSDGAIVVGSDEIPSGSTLSVTYTVTVPDDAQPGDTFTIVGELTARDQIDSGELTFPTITLSVTDEPADPPNLEIDNIAGGGDITRAPGEQISVDVTVTNTGELEGTQDVEFVLNGSSVATEQLTLSQGQTDTVTLTATAPGDVGATLDWFVQTANDTSDTFSLEIGTREFEVTGLDPVQPVVDQGQTLTVTADITNTGSLDGETTATLTIGGLTFTTTETVANGTTETVQFDVNTESLDPGQYTHTVAVDQTQVSGTLTIEPSVVTYQDANGEVGLMQVQTVITDWQSGQIGIQLVGDVIAAWQS